MRKSPVCACSSSASAPSSAARRTSYSGSRPVDPPPFFWLQGVVSSNALLMTVAVLIRQNRMAKVAEHRAHLDLQINLLTEQKVTKILQIVDALTRELTALRKHPDSDIA